MAGTNYILEVRPNIPKQLRGLEELAGDLLYSWDRLVRGLFYRLDRKLWEKCGHNPKLMLRRVSQKRLDEVTGDNVFMEEYHRIMSAYNSYHRKPPRPEVAEHLHADKDLVAYFCAEYGFFESLPLYSGGLGILAGDQCKAASDLGLSFVAMGLLYRQGYFRQTIDGQGNQIAQYTPSNFDDLPITPAKGKDGKEVRVRIDLPNRSLQLKVWVAKAGHMHLYLLDSDLSENTDKDRFITHQLYGGDTGTRIQQEIVLGIGGVRALRALGLNPTVWHINEGHAAFQILERVREWVMRGLDFDSALELVAAGTIFTTHTPVLAGHDIFLKDVFESFFAGFAREMGIDNERLFSLGGNPSNHDGFNMTTLALRGSRFQNGVSRLHGRTASEMEAFLWPQIQPEENPIGHVTNGVHVPSFLRGPWANLFDMRFGGEWRNQLLNPKYWQRVDEIPDHQFWSIRQTLKSKLLEDASRRLVTQCRRNRYSQAHIERLIRRISPTETDVLILGFARRFATYKRATLVFSEPERLARLLNDPERPVLLFFAGKAHPKDEQGQALIREIHDFSRRPEFEGKIFLLEDYDLSLARTLVTGTDVWVNTPEYPLEASGTSGQKAAINGVINLSVLVGWWDEGYNGENGWSINPHDTHYDADYRNREEAKELMDTLENLVLPLYFNRDGKGHSSGWVKMAKASMKSMISRFSSQRMMMDYVRGYYAPAARQQAQLGAENGTLARTLAGWKQKVSEAWPRVGISRADGCLQEIRAGESLRVSLSASLGGLEPEDVRVECVVGTMDDENKFTSHECHVFTADGRNSAGDTLFNLDLRPALPGLQYYKIRIFPFHKLLSHPFETGRMIWL